MKYLPTLAFWLLGIVFGVVGVAHLVSVADFAKFLPEWFPLPVETVVATGVLEIVLAVGLFLSKYRPIAGKLVFLLLVIYTPLHVVDVMREAPVIGPKVVAIIRLPMQGLLLYLAWVVGWRAAQAASNPVS